MKRKQKEIWKDINEYGGLYEISNHGRIRSVDRYVRSKNNSRALKKGKVLKGIIHYGYRRVGLHKNTKISYFNIGRLVAEAFIPNLENKPEINHKDFNRSNNNVNNLEWVTRKENVRHAIDNGKWVNVGNNFKGEDGYQSKLKEKDILEIRKLGREGNITQKQISKLFGINPSNVSYIINNKTWKHLNLSGNTP